METKYFNYCIFMKSKNLIESEYSGYTCILDLEKLSTFPVEDLIDIISINTNKYDWPVSVRCSLPDGSKANIEFKRFCNYYTNISAALAINYQKSKRRYEFYLHADVEGYGQELDAIFRTLPDEYKLLAEVED